MIEHPELTDERRARIVARCEEQLSSMLAEAEEWYPDGRLSSEQLRKEHDGFCKRLGSLASDMGYASFVELLHNEGYDIELDPRAAANPVGHRIAPEEAVDSIVASVTGKLGSYFDKIDEWYPDRVVAGFAKLHGKTKDNLSKQAQALGYISWAELLQDYGYEVPDYGAKVGRPVTTDPVAVVDELARRYEGREPAADVNALKEENPDLAPKLKSVANSSKAVFGKSFGRVLRERGIVGGGARKRGGAVTEREAEDTLEWLAGFVSGLDVRPTSLGRLKTAVARGGGGMAEALDSIGIWSKRLYGKTPAQLLKSKGILVGGAGSRSTELPLDDVEVEAIINGLREKYAHAARPRTASDFGEANPEWKSNIQSITRYLSKHGLGTPSKFLSNEQLVSRVSWDESLPRPSAEELEEFSASASADPQELLASLPGAKLVELDASIDVKREHDGYKYYEMLRRGDFVELVTDGAFVSARFCGCDLGTVWFQGGAGRELASMVRYPTEWGLAGRGVYACVTDILGGKNGASLRLNVFYAEDASSSTISQGLLISVDGKRILDCVVAKLPGKVVISEGIEAIERGAFETVEIGVVSLPSTLRFIGERAFCKTGLERVLIPAGVTHIGAAAFSHASGDCGFSYRSYDGPVYIDVEEGNPRYESSRGSLVELDGDIRRLLSCYYKRPRRESCTITVPKGVNVLGPGCFTAYRFVWPRIEVPEGVTRIEADCFAEFGMERAELPASLVDIDDYSWLELCGWDSGPYVDGVVDMPEGPLELDPPSRLRIAKGNPRYSVKGRYAYALPVEQMASVSEAGAQEDDDAAVDEDFDEATFRYDGKGRGFVYSFKFPNKPEDELSMASEYLDWL